jgi:hypothetical protein
MGERLSSLERKDHEMKSPSRLATNRRLIELEASLDTYLEERRRSGKPATSEDVVDVSLPEVARIATSALLGTTLVGITTLNQIQCS